MAAEELLSLLGWTIVAAPVALLLTLGSASLLGRPLRETSTNRLVSLFLVVGLLAALSLVGSLIVLHQEQFTIEIAHWVVLPGSVETTADSSHSASAENGDHYHFAVKFLFDRLSLPLVVLSFVLCGTISAFASRYMHRDPGFNRFFVLFSIFVTGMVITSTAGTIETLFAGWELVGLSSALLVAYFQERPAPTRNGLRIWSIYRLGDAALLLAAVLLHNLTREGDFYGLLGEQPWPGGRTPLSESQALGVGLLLLCAAAVKSALVPFSGWLPRAMEGPTPSSAVFYGALSVHLGAFLLLRLDSLLATSALLAWCVVGLGLITALYAWVVGNVQTDIKSALCFAALLQVGLIVAEIGMGWYYLALTHLIGHACFRTLQFLRAPSLLADYHILERAVGSRLPANTQLPLASAWLYRFGHERGYLDVLLDDWLVSPLLRLFRFFDRWERQIQAWMTGQANPAHTPLPTARTDELS